LFLVFITGLLVLFSYIVAIRPNASFTQRKLSTKTILITIVPYPLIKKEINRPIKREKKLETNLQQIFNARNTPIY